MTYCTAEWKIIKLNHVSSQYVMFLLNLNIRINQYFFHFFRKIIKLYQSLFWNQQKIVLVSWILTIDVTFSKYNQNLINVLVSPLNDTLFSYIFLFTSTMFIYDAIWIIMNRWIRIAYVKDNILLNSPMSCLLRQCFSLKLYLINQLKASFFISCSIYHIIQYI